MGFKILQWSDTHQAKQTGACNALIESASDIDCVIHCGDLAADYFENNIAPVSLKNTLCVIGNHDAFLQAGTDPAGYHWELQPTQAQLRERYILPLMNAFGVDSPDGTTWWKKLYPTQGVMLIGVNDTALGDTAEKQLRFVEETVSECESSGYGIVLVKHGPPPSIYPIKCNFTTANTKDATIWGEDYENTYPEANSYLAPLRQSNAKIICILYGHNHMDTFSSITQSNGVKIPVIGIGSVLADSFNDLPRTSNGTINDIVMNQIEYVPELDSLRVYRLGAYGSALGCSRKMLTWSYDKGKIVSCCSNRGK